MSEHQTAEQIIENARNAAPEQVAQYMASAEKYLDEFGIEEMDRTHFLGLFAQACIMNAHTVILDLRLTAIRTELEWITRAIRDSNEIASK